MHSSTDTILCIPKASAWTHCTAALGAATPGRTLGQPRLAAGGRAQHRRAAAAHDHCLRVAEDRRAAQQYGTLSEASTRSGYTRRCSPQTARSSQYVAGKSSHSKRKAGARGRAGRIAHIWKQPWHFTSMKKEFGDCTRRLYLHFCFSKSAGGCSRSISLDSTCAGPTQHADSRHQGQLIRTIADVAAGAGAASKSHDEQDAPCSQLQARKGCLPCCRALSEPLDSLAKLCSCWWVSGQQAAFNKQEAAW